MKNIKFSWKAFDYACTQLALQIKKQKWFKEIKYIYGIPKGGLSLAVKLAHLLKLHLIAAENIPLHLENKILVVDEIVDTGKTLIKKDLVKFKIATIHYKPWAKIKPDCYVFKTFNYITYPWEI